MALTLAAFETVWNDTTKPKTLVITGALAGDYLFMVGGSAHVGGAQVTAMTTTTTVGTTGAWTEPQENLNSPTSEAWISSAVAQVTADGDVTVQVAITSTASPQWGFTVVRARGSAGLGVSGFVDSSSTKVVSLAVQQGSGVLVGAFDFSEGAIGTAWVPSTDVTLIERTQVVGFYTLHAAYWENQAAGTRDYGWSGGTTSANKIIGLEILAAPEAAQVQANPFVPWRRWYRVRGMFRSTYDLLTDQGLSAALGSADVPVTVGLTASGGVSGSASVSPAVAITAVGVLAVSGTAAAAVTATLTAAGSATGAASVAESVSVTAAGTMAASGAASVTETVGRSAAGTATGSASVSASVAIAATGSPTFVGSAAVTETATVTAAGSADGSASVDEVVSISADGTTSGSATQAVTASVAASGSATGSASVASAVAITASGNLVVGLAGSASRDVTVTISAAGNMAATGTAAVAALVGRTVSGLTSGSASVAASVAITATGGLGFTGTASRSVTVGVTAAGGAAGSATRTVSVSITATGVLFVPPSTFYEGVLAGGVRVGPGDTGGTGAGSNAVGHVLLGTIGYFDVYDDLYLVVEGTVPAGTAGAARAGPSTTGGQLAATSVTGGSR